jgi:hypothetical protein
MSNKPRKLKKKKKPPVARLDKVRLLEEMVATLVLKHNQLVKFLEEQGVLKKEEELITKPTEEQITKIEKTKEKSE